MSTVLVFGASGQIGGFLLPQLRQTHAVIGVSRNAAVEPGWLRGDLDRGDLDRKDNAWPAAQVVVSLGPLDAFAGWLERYDTTALRRVIAFSSMSAESKTGSPDPAERELAARLIDAESRVWRVANAAAIPATVFRPTLIYGAGTDKSLAPIARFARRWRVLPVPLGASGLRQPVHAADLAQAVLDALDNPASYGNTYPLGGGERLRFDDLIRRLRACVPGLAMTLPVPTTALRWFARRHSGAVHRLRASLVADNSAAQRDFGYRPRAFEAHDVLPSP